MTKRNIEMDNPFIDGVRILIRKTIDEEFETLFADNIEEIVAKLVPIEVSAYLHQAFKKAEFGDMAGKSAFTETKNVKRGPRPRCDMIGCGWHGRCKKKQSDGSWKCDECGA